MAKIVTITNPLTGQPAQVDQLDHTAQQIDDGLNIARGVSNPNLLDNWYFGNPVDQRQGRVVKPNTTYYSDNQLTTSAGTTSAYVTAYRYATGTASGVNYASFKLTNSDTAPTYYAEPGNVVRGYSAGYGIDRWIASSNALVKLSDNGVSILRKVLGKSFAMLYTKIHPSQLLGKTVTLSAIINDRLHTVTGTIPTTIPSNNTAVLIGEKYNSMWVQMYFSNGILEIGSVNQSDNDCICKAIKLELGTTQTLAHQDSSGNWVLNEIPDYGEQLLRCQRYFQTFATESLRPANALDFRPVMRTNPALSTITVDGKTLYTASADL